MFKKRKLSIGLLSLLCLSLVVVFFYSNFAGNHETLGDKVLLEEPKNHGDPILDNSDSQQENSESVHAMNTENEFALVLAKRTSFEEDENRDFRFNPNPEELYNLAEHVDKLLERYNELPNGELAMFLRRALLKCRFAPNSSREVEEKVSDIERTAERNGKSSGYVVAHEDALKNLLYECEEIANNHPEIDFDDVPRRLLLEAADAGVGVVAAKLALGSEFPGNSNDVDEDFLHAYRKKVGATLLAARNKCDPSAMQIFATGVNENEYWYDESGDPLHIKYYANQLMLVLYYENNVIDTPEEKLEHKRRVLDAKVRYNNLSEADVAEAQAYGRSLYEKFCLN